MEISFKSIILGLPKWKVDTCDNVWMNASIATPLHKYIKGGMMYAFQAAFNKETSL